MSALSPPLYQNILGVHLLHRKHYFYKIIKLCVAICKYIHLKYCANGNLCVSKEIGITRFLRAKKSSARLPSKGK